MIWHSRTGATSVQFFERFGRQNLIVIFIFKCLRWNILNLFISIISEVDYCLGNPCKEGSTCVNLAFTFECKCATGFYGHKCDGRLCFSESI